MRDTIMKLKTLKSILKTYLSNHCEMCKGTLGFSSEIYIHPFIKTVVIRTDHTMAKGKVMIYKKLHRKLKIEQHEPRVLWEKQKHTKSRYNKDIYFSCLQ
jgi:hypothetical protein